MDEKEAERQVKMVDSLIEDLENSDYDRLGLDSLQFDEEAMD